MSQRCHEEIPSASLSAAAIRWSIPSSVLQIRPACARVFRLSRSARFEFGGVLGALRPFSTARLFGCESEARQNGCNRLINFGAGHLATIAQLRYQSKN